MDSKKLLEEINALAKKAKEEGLTEEETARRDQLRQEYLQWFRAGFAQRLENIVLVDPDGSERHLKRKD